MAAATRVRVAGVAGVVGGLGWATLVALRFAADRGATLLGYGTLDVLTPLCLVLALVGVTGHRSLTRTSWGRLAVSGFGMFVAGLVGTLAGSAVYVGAGILDGWTVSVWAYAVTLVGATAFGVGLLSAGVPPRSGAGLLAGSLPVGLAVSLALAASGVVPDEAVVPVGPGALLGVGVAALGWWLAAKSSTANERR